MVQSHPRRETERDQATTPLPDPRHRDRGPDPRKLTRTPFRSPPPPPPLPPQGGVPAKISEKYKELLNPECPQKNTTGDDGAKPGTSVLAAGVANRERPPPFTNGEEEKAPAQPRCDLDVDGGLHRVLRNGCSMHGPGLPCGTRGW